MAKESKNINFSKATISKEDDKYIITEKTKDETKVYNLSDKLDEWLDIEGVSLKISKDIEIPSEE